MTTTTKPRVPNFPADPNDGQQIVEYLDGNSVLIWTYDEATNSWNYQKFGPEHGGYITTDQVISAEALPSGDSVTQAAINKEQSWTSFNQSRKQVRRETNVDFIQNTVIDGQWKFYQPVVGDGQLPPAGEFYVQDGDGHVTNEWAKVRSITINGTDSNQRASLAEIRKGQTLIIQDVVLNTFVQYVVSNVNFIGLPEGGQFWVEADLVVAFNRAVGIVPDDTICEIKFTKPRPCLTTNRGGEPVVDDDGYLWYNELNKTLYVSDWNDTQGANGDATWIPVGNGDGSGGSVHVGEDPPSVDLFAGCEWFDTTRLELFIYYVDDDGNAGWVPSSPLGARVEAGEEIQRQLVGRVQSHDSALNDLYATQSDLLTSKGSNDVTTAFRIKSGGNTLVSASGNKLGLYNLSEPTNASHAVNLGYLESNFLNKTKDQTFNGGALRFKRTDDVSYWNYITFDTPHAWHGDNKTHGAILNIGTTNSYKQQFKIQGRSGRDLFEIHDDGAAAATIKGNLNCTVELKEAGKRVATQEYVNEQVSSVGGGSFQTKYDGNRYNIANGMSTTPLDTGEVMFLNAQMVATINPSDVAYIGLPIEEFNWDACIQSGVVKVNMGSMESGYYSVFRKKTMSGRNVLLYVSPLWTDNEMKLEPEIGCPLFFHGVFFE